MGYNNKNTGNKANYNRKGSYNKSYNKTNSGNNKQNDNRGGGPKFLIIAIVAIIIIVLAILLITGKTSVDKILNLINGISIETQSIETTSDKETTTTLPITTNTQTPDSITISDEDYLKVYYIDVGQGDSILIEEGSKGNKTYMLIDAGTSTNHPASMLISQLKELGVGKLKYFIMTHPHSDHIGAAASVINTFEIETAFLPDCKYDTKTWNNVLTALDEHENINIEIVDNEYLGNTYNIVNAYFKILWPQNPSSVKSSDINNVSIVCRLVYGESKFMLTGDAETTSEAKMLTLFDSNEFQSDVLKAGHHGSNTSSSQEFLNVVKPQYVIISCGEGNSYGHPHVEPMERFQKMNCTILRTDLLGTIVIVSDGKNISVEN